MEGDLMWYLILGACIVTLLADFGLMWRIGHEAKKMDTGRHPAPRRAASDGKTNGADSGRRTLVAIRSGKIVTAGAAVWEHHAAAARASGAHVEKIRKTTETVN